MQQEVQIQKKGKLEVFKKKHSEMFLYFLEEYEKWRELKKQELL